MRASNKLRPYLGASYSLEWTGCGYRVDIFDQRDGGAMVAASNDNEFEYTADAVVWAKVRIEGLGIFDLGGRNA